MPVTLKFGYQMGIKNQKGTVSVEKYRNRVRLRWRYKSKRYSLSLGAYNKPNLTASRKIVLQIELDLANGNFDKSLVRYGGKELKVIDELPKTIVEHFETWVTNYKQLNCNKNSDYYHLRNTLRKWGEIAPAEMLFKLNSENYSPKTYNERLSMLNGFSIWMQKQKNWDINPFEGVSRRKVIKTEKPDRLPFTEHEIRLILDAIKNDTYCPKSSRYKHSFYYNFIYFLFRSGVRNAEAVGLRVGCLDFESSKIVVKEALARTVNGTHAAARVRKGTKNSKVRILPFTDDLKTQLAPLTVGKLVDDLVFTSVTGKPIDDRMFQRRVFSVVLKGLNLPHRVLYACRHTFASRCIDAGFSPVTTAFLLGNNPETALRNYTHQLNIPKDLPSI
ncbi:MAG: site-specific integrase [Chitinophagaceae bacterium]